MWEDWLIESALPKLTESSKGCAMYEDSAVKLFPGLAHPLAPKQPKEPLARVEIMGAIQEELLGRRILLSLPESEALLEML